MDKSMPLTPQVNVRTNKRQLNTNGINIASPKLLLPQCETVRSQPNIDSDLSNNLNRISPTRLRPARHVIGFRGYNRAHELERKVKELMVVLYTHIQSPFQGLNIAIENTEFALNGLQAAEREFYAAADKIKKYENKTRELDFLKANIESCIKSSIEQVRQDFRSSVHADMRSIKSVSILNELDKIINEPWRGHRQLGNVIGHLKGGILSLNHLQTVFPNLKDPNSQETMNLLNKVNRYVNAKDSLPTMKQMVTAKIDEEELNKLLFELKNTEALYHTSLSLQQATASVVLKIHLEANATTRKLRQRTQKIIANECQSRNIDEESTALFAFIANGQKYESESTKKEEQTHRLFQPPSPERPIWSEAWTSRTKLHKHN